MPSAKSPELGALVDFLELDPRPSFVVDLDVPDAAQIAYMPIAYSNPALLLSAELSALLAPYDKRGSADPASLNFRHWVTRVASRPHKSGESPGLYRFHNTLWSATLHGRLLHVSGLPQASIESALSGRLEVSDNLTTVVSGEVPATTTPNSAAKAVDSRRGDGADLADAALHRGRAANLGMLAIPQSPHVDFFFSIDWASTTVGPIETWADEVHVLCNLVMTDPEPALLFLGDELVVVHNEPARALFPQTQANFMGNTVAKLMPEVHKAFASMFERLKTDHTVESYADMAVMIPRAGRLDECFVSARYLPIMDKSGKFLGIYHSVREVTKENLYRRRLATLLQVSTCVSNITDLGTYWSPLIETLADNKPDIAFAMAYSLEATTTEALVLNQEVPRVCTLEASLNLPEGHPGAPLHLKVHDGSEGLSVAFSTALQTDEPVRLDAQAGGFAAELVKGIECRSYAAPCQGAMVCPIRPAGGSQVIGFLVIGISSRIALDRDYTQFVEILNKHIAHTVASVALYRKHTLQAEVRAAEAAHVHKRLRQRLDSQRQQLLTSETKFQRLTDTMPIGVTTTDQQGNIMYANEAFYSITGHTGENVTAESWMALVHDEDKMKAAVEFTQLWETKKATTFEIRMKKPWIREMEGAETVTTATWLLTSAYIESDADGRPLCLYSALTDISAQKWAEDINRRRMNEALELKRQQENFIDTISHEIRNPLSAMLQSADEISHHLNSLAASKESLDEMLNGSLEAIETILLCCQHQRRVIDDVLMLSKVNSDMLAICPVAIDPKEMVTSVIKMFAGRAKKEGISLELVVEDSLASIADDSLLLDPSRVSQVLVNLVGNALKFTRNSPEKNVKVICGLSNSPPTFDDHGVTYMSTQFRKNIIDTTAIDPSDIRFLNIIITDTGEGMRDHQKKKLFKRFAQASPRTSVRYGGSGLGLYISKQLCELQGGAIGLQMGDQTGATFAFYVATSICARGGSYALPDVDTATLLRTLDIHDTPSLLSLSPTSASMSPPPNFFPPTPPSDPGYTLLVVEDNLINQRVMAKQLRRRGYNVFTANHGAECLSYLETSTAWRKTGAAGVPLDLILMDIEMPVMDGLTCARQIRENEEAGLLVRRVPIVSVTANARMEQIKASKDAGIDDNVSKPFQMDDLIPKIERLLVTKFHVAMQD